MANSPICRTQIITISIFNEVVVVLLVVLVDAKSHHVATLYSPQIRKQDTQSQPGEAILELLPCNSTTFRKMVRKVVSEEL